MKHRVFFCIIIFCSLPTVAATDTHQNLRQDVKRLQQQSENIQRQLKQLQKQLAKQAETVKQVEPSTKAKTHKRQKGTTDKQGKVRSGVFHSSAVTVHSLENDPESLEFYPTALVADEHVVTYIAGTPVVSSPYLGSRPAFDGSDYIVNISSINRDIRLMQQRRRLYRAYEGIGYPIPQMPIIAISGKVEPDAVVGDPFSVNTGRSGDLTLGSGELDVAAILNKNVEAYISFAYDSSPPDIGGQRLSNSSVDLNMGFVNIGDLDRTPFYFTGGQLYVPFGRFATAMVSAPLTMIMARTKSRPFIFGYKSQQDSGPFAAVYGFKSDTNLGSTGTGGVNLGYIIDTGYSTGEIGASLISSIDDAGGMQFTGSKFATTFGGFSSPTNGSELVHKVPAAGVHGHLSIDRYNFTAEWVSTTGAFRKQDLSFNGRGARPQAGQLEAAITFKTYDKPASVAIGYQWSKETLALNLPKQRLSGVFNISIWKDTVESLEYRHDINFNKFQYANGAAPSGSVNANTYGRGGATDTLLAQIGVYF